MFYAIDVETTGLTSEDRICLVAYENVHYSHDRGILDPIENPDTVIDFFSKTPRCYFFFNAPFDLFHLSQILPPEIQITDYFDLMPMIAKIAKQPLKLVDVASFVLDSKEFEEYSTLKQKIEEFDFTLRPLPKELERYALFDVHVTALLALRFKPYWFLVREPNFQNKNVSELLDEYGSTFNFVLQELFKTNLVGYLYLLDFLKERIKSFANENIENQNATLKRRATTVKQYALGRLLDNPLGLQILRKVDVTLPRKPFTNLTLTDEEREVLESSLVDAYEQVVCEIYAKTKATAYVPPFNNEPTDHRTLNN